MVKKNNSYEKLIQADNLPCHIAIIMDGNGRWAHKRLLPRTMGHRAGMNTLKEIVRACSDLGIKILTVYAFSTENWKRPWEEVDYLMKLLVEFLRKEINELNQNQVRIKVLGNYNSLPLVCQAEIEDAINTTNNNSGLLFNIALNYGSRQEILGAVKNLAQQIASGEINPDMISEESISRQLYTKDIPDPDLLIRTAGEMRISNFLLWQIAYTELWITECLWPEFTKDDLLHAIWDYQQRDRRFGGLNSERQDEINA
ncbi:MAG: isoprenyl transferase [Syntrophomonadaceae bacterium]|nr:isoprenyl transferase [Syntrophomonadaceae bacterium]MDD3022741.1 isoprenyl transferase [Syntrophomonadaceae bacterium]